MPLNDFGEVYMHEQILSLRFAFRIGSIYVERKIFDESGEICETIFQQNSRTVDGIVWNLTRGMYRVFGLTDAEVSASMVLMTPPNSTSTVQVPTPPTIKLESSDLEVHVISDSNDDVILDVQLGESFAFPFRRRGSVNSTPSLPVPNLRRSPSILSSRPPIHPNARKTRSVLEALRLIASRKGSKSELASLDFGSFQLEQVNYLPPQFDGDKIFELPPLLQGCPTLYRGDMDGMDKQYDGHTWYKTMTTNIANNVDLKFRKSSCTGHLRCSNSSYVFLSRNFGKVNKTEWIGIILCPLVVGGDPPPKFTLAYKVCHTPPECLALYDAKIYYVFSNNQYMTRVVVHIGYHDHPISDGVCLDSLDLMYECDTRDCQNS